MSRPRLLFHAGGDCLERYGSLVRATSVAESSGYTFTRTGTALMESPTGLISAGADIPRVDYSSGAPALLVEQSRTNLALHSADISNAAWGVSGAAKTAATSLVAGGTAQTITSTATGAEALVQYVGTLTATPETWSALVENVDAAQSRFGIYDGTVADWVARATFTWSTGAISGLVGAAGSAQSARTRYMGTGPNGGDVYLWQITGTPANEGNSRRIYIYPGAQLVNTDAVVMHYGQHEAAPFASSLIVTGAASATRNAERFTVPVGFTPQEMTFFADFVNRGDADRGTTPILLSIGGGSPTLGSNFFLGGTGVDGALKWQTGWPGGSVQSTFGSGIAYGQRVRTICQLSQTSGAWSMTVAHRVDDGAVVTAVVTAVGTVSSSWHTSWAGIGCVANTDGPSLSPVRSIKIAAGIHGMTDMESA